ncbi:MAG: hypothetical protein LEGION0398_MBIBDBAK_00383 [Legionellaceae bacterium]
MKLVNTLLWLAIIILTLIIVYRIIERVPLPASIINVKTILTEKTLPAFKSTKKDIFSEQQETEKNTVEEEKF